MEMPGDTSGALWRGIKARAVGMLADYWLIAVAVVCAATAFVLAGRS